MNRMMGFQAFVVGVALTISSLTVGIRVAAQESDTWDPEAAAVYLDSRQALWMEWPTAARDHGTFCVSCHSTVPYALARTVLRADAPGVVERRLLENIETRVSSWEKVRPFYSDEEYRVPKTSQSRGTEAILNALMLANRDARHGSLEETTLQAFDNLWALQVTTGKEIGSWPWLNFGLEPWETEAAQYYGAALAAIAVGIAPDGYGSTPSIQKHLALLQEYLHREGDAQHLFNRVTALWAAAVLPGGLDSIQWQATIDEALRRQQEDGGWSLVSLGMFERKDGTPLDTRSDGYATGLVVYTLQRVGMGADDPRLNKGLTWLRRNQNADGSWNAFSLNKARDPDSNRGRFMKDVATAYAVLALTEAK